MRLAPPGHIHSKLPMLLLLNQVPSFFFNHVVLTEKQKNYRDSAPLNLSLFVQVFRRLTRVPTFQGWSKSFSVVSMIRQETENLRWFPHNIQAIMAKIMLAKKTS